MNTTALSFVRLSGIRGCLPPVVDAGVSRNHAGVMAYFLEYTVPASDEDGEYTFPVSEEHRGYTVPLTETDAEIVHSERLPIRGSILASSIEDAKVEAEKIIQNSRATTGYLYEDPGSSSQVGSGNLILKYTESSGWERQ